MNSKLQQQALVRSKEERETDFQYLPGRVETCLLTTSRYLTDCV